MKDIFVSHSKEDKGIAKKLVSKLESTGLSCYVYSRDKNAGTEEELVSRCSIFILILSESSQNSQELIRQIKIAVENNCQIIPFRNGKTDSGLGTQYLLHSLEWVDAYEDGFNEAYEILLEIIEEITDGKPVRTISKKKKSERNNNFNIKKSHLTAVIAVFAIIIIYLIFFNDTKESNLNNENGITNNNEVPDFIKSELSDEEKNVVGSWKMKEYQDSRVLPPEEQVEMDKNIQELKKRVQLNYKPDRSFERIGFTEQVQRGYWEYDHIKKKIYLTPAGTDKKETVNIVSLTKTEMTIVVTEIVQLPQGGTETVTTKITFQKV